MRTRLLAAALVAVAVATGAQGCDPCFGTPSCHTAPQVSYGGHFIEHATGRAVSGVRVEFVRRSGVELSRDTLVAISDAQGFFQLRGEAFVAGLATGDLIVTPPEPHPPYTVESLALQTSESRGEGLFAGRLVVDPYYPLVAEVRDRESGELVRGAEIRFARTGGIAAEPDTFVATSDGDGRIFVDIRMFGAGKLAARAVVNAPGYPRAYDIPLRLQARYIDRPPQEVDVLRLGRALQYVVLVHRRGTSEVHPGVQFEFRRRDGIPVDPDTIVIDVPPSGAFALPIEPLADGVVRGDVTIRAPAPFETETLPNVELRTLDGDTVTLLRFGYGTQVYAVARFVYRATGLPVEEGIQVAVRRRSGTVFEPDGVLTLIDSTSTLRYSAATENTGTSIVDVEVRLRDPFDADTLFGLVLQSRRDSMPTDFGTISVGRWLPWFGEVRSADTDAPIAGARVEFRRTSGVLIAPTSAVSTTTASGSFRVAPGAMPLRDGEVVGELNVSAPGYQTAVLPDVRVPTSSDDTIRMLPVIRLERSTP